MPYSSTIYKTLICIGLMAAAYNSSAQKESIQVALNQAQYQPGDTIKMACWLPAWEGTARLGTLNVQIEDVKYKNGWRMRYPLLEGWCEAEWVLPSDFPEAVYNITLRVQPVFFQLNGRLRNKGKEDSLRYTFMLPDKSVMAGAVKLNPEGAFRLPRHVYSGDATLYFSPMKAAKGRNDLEVSISTPLDSAYQALADTSILLAVGIASLQDATGLFATDTIDFEKGTLQAVTVTGQTKNKVQVYDDKASTGFFKHDRAKIFSGLDGEFSGFMSIIDYLIGRVAGLDIVRDNNEFGAYSIAWRGLPTAFFIDEVPVDMEAIYSYPTSEIAMLKVYPPPFLGTIMGGGGGAIAIYSKQATVGDYKNKHRFLVQGFSPGTTILQHSGTQ